MSTPSPVTGTAKSRGSALPPTSSPSSRLVLGHRSHKRAAPNGVRRAVSNGSSHKKRRTQQSSSDGSDSDDSDDDEEKDNGNTSTQHNGEPEMPRRYIIKPQPPPPAPPSKLNTAFNTLHNYFSTAALSLSSSSSSPASLVISSSSSSPARRSSTPPSVSSEVAAVLSVVSPHEANVARQASAMKRIARLHAQLQSDMTWDPGKRAEEKSDSDGDEDDEEKEDEHKEGQHIVTAPAQPITTPQRKGRPPPLNSSLIQTPPFRLLSAHTAPHSARVVSTTKRTHTAPAARRATATASSSKPPKSVSSAALSPTPSDLPAAVFTRRHLPLARAERRMRAEQRRESTENWITCDACSKWRLQLAQQQRPDDTAAVATTSQHYYCGGGDTVDDDECERLDDWIVRCVGEGRAMQLSDVGVDTVEVLAEASGKRRRELERAMERLGMEFDSTTQKIKCFSVSRGE